jgi:glutamate racemase
MIGIFDSGIGGLTVARAIERLLPHHPFIYFGDTARTPYGTKSAQVIIDYSLRNAEFLLQKGADVIVIGCNSASSVATESLRQEFRVPVFEVIGPAAEQAVAYSSHGRIGVIGTRATIRSGIYEKTIGKLNPAYQVFSESCPLLVPLVEEGWTNRQESKMIIRRYLHPLKNKQIDTLILGCTHYPLLKNLIQARIGKKVRLIDSSVEIASTLQRELPQGEESKTNVAEPSRLYFSDLTISAQNIASSIFGRTVELLSP